MRNKMKNIKITILFFLFLSIPLFPDSILLDDGNTIEGEITQMDVDEIVLKEKDGNFKKITTSKIAKIFLKKKAFIFEEPEKKLTDEEKKSLLKAKERKTQEMESKKKALEEEVKRSKKEEADKKKKLDELKNKLAKDKQDHSKEIQEKEAELDYLRSRIKEQDKKIEDQQSNISNLKMTEEENSQEIKKLKKELAKGQINPNPSKETAESKKEPLNANAIKTVSWSTVGRSAILPGSGHIKLEQKWTGYTYSALFFSSLAYTIYQYNKTNVAQKNYSNIPFIPTQEGIILGYSLSNTALSEYQSEKSKLTQGFSLMALIYITQLSHAYFSGKKYEETAGLKIKRYSEFTLASRSDEKRELSRVEIYYEFRF